MSNFDPSKLSLSYLPPATPFRPIEGRKYTLTHSNHTGELFLTIGCEYDTGKIDPKMRDEVLGEWIPHMGEFQLMAKVYVSGGEFDDKYAKVRYLIFRKELETALKAIILGDQSFLTFFPWLLDSPIYIQFESDISAYHQVLYYGTPRQYMTSIYTNT